MIPSKTKSAGIRPRAFLRASDMSASVDLLRRSIISEDDSFAHDTKILPKVRDQYRDSGFATRVILQDPLTHKGPTTACTIGFPTNLPRHLWTERLRLFKRFVCRVHVDIASGPDGFLWSIPHVEPDPVFHWKEHIEYSTIKHLDIRGPPAVKILKHFLHL